MRVLRIAKWKDTIRAVLAVPRTTKATKLRRISTGYRILYVASTLPSCTGPKRLGHTPMLQPILWILRRYASGTASTTPEDEDDDDVVLEQSLGDGLIRSGGGGAQWNRASIYK
jgi:hypothetical protein